MDSQIRRTMVSIGDLKNNLKILQSEAKQMKYQDDFDLEGLAKGNPQSLLPLYNHLFTTYNTTFTEEVLNVVGDVLSTKSDVRFIESVYKILRDMLNFKPSMTKEQFFTLNNFAERKIIMCIEIMRIVRERCRFMGPKNPTNPHIRVNSVVDSGLHAKKEDGKGEPIPCEDVKSVSSQRLKPMVEAYAEANSETALQRKSSDKVCRPAHSLMGISEKDSWHLKLGYLRPKSPEEESAPSKKEEIRKRSLSRDKGRSASRDKGPNQQKKSGKRSIESKLSDGIFNGPDRVPNDWDPSEAVECILSKVRDLPNQLTSFMKAVESRLLKIEDRLDFVEALVTGMNLAEGKASCGDLKREVELLQARITLLENRVTLAESKAKNPTLLETLKQFHATEDKKSEFSTGSFAVLERGADPSWQQMHYFSPIHPAFVNPDDTVNSLAEIYDRRSSTPDHWANRLYGKALDSGIAASTSQQELQGYCAAEDRVRNKAGVESRLEAGREIAVDSEAAEGATKKRTTGKQVNEGIVVNVRTVEGSQAVCDSFTTVYSRDRELTAYDSSLYCDDYQKNSMVSSARGQHAHDEQLAESFERDLLSLKALRTDGRKMASKLETDKDAFSDQHTARADVSDSEKEILRCQNNSSDSGQFTSNGKGDSVLNSKLLSSETAKSVGRSDVDNTDGKGDSFCGADHQVDIGSNTPHTDIVTTATARPTVDMDLSAAGGTLDTSTLQQVERIKQLFKATQQLFPAIEIPNDEG